MEEKDKQNIDYSEQVVVPKNTLKPSIKKILIVVFVVIILGGVGFIAFLLSNNKILFYSVRDKYFRQGTSDTEAVPTPEVTITETEVVDRFNESVLDEELWTTSTFGSAPEIKIQNGRVLIQTPADTEEFSVGILTLETKPIKDFNASIDISPVVIEESSQTVFIFHKHDADWSESLSVVLGKNSEGQIYVQAKQKLKDQQEEVLGVKLFQGGETFKISMTRQGSTVRFYVNGETFAEETNTYSGEGGLSLYVGSYGPRPLATISAFDNLNLIYTELQ